jgi:integrase
VWYAKYRGPDGRQRQRSIGRAWSGKGRPPAGFFTSRTAELWLAQTLDREAEQAVAGSKVGEVLFADAAREWLRYVEHDRACKPSTLRSYRSSVDGRFLPVFGALALERITQRDVERWRAGLSVGPQTKNKLLVELHGIFKRAERVYGLRTNPVAGMEKLRVGRQVDLQVFTPEEVRGLVAAAACEQDAATYLTAAFTGLRRGELLALRWCDVDFAGSLVRVRQSYSAKALTVPKSGKVRSVPLAPEVAGVLALLGQREHWTDDEDLVFVGKVGGYLDNSALRRRYVKALAAAGLRPLRFHDLRHTFGTRMIAKADIVRVKEWMGHADVQTTMRYLHYSPKPDDAQLVAEAFAAEPVLAAAA